MRSLAEARRRSDPSFWNALNRVLFALIIVCGAAGVVLWFYPEVVRRDQMAENLLRDQQELLSLQSLRKHREREVYLLENDKEYIETIARDKLDMMKEGETIFRLDPSKGLKPTQKSP
ncbi:MAG TPA: septum formation initiator family protein [Terrimicrobiaceae bacterium]